MIFEMEMKIYTTKKLQVLVITFLNVSSLQNNNNKICHCNIKQLQNAMENYWNQMLLAIRLLLQTKSKRKFS